jgi:hypothetical protein
MKAYDPSSGRMGGIREGIEDLLYFVAKVGRVFGVDRSMVSPDGGEKGGR